jgi:hypothetical protein
MLIAQDRKHCTKNAHSRGYTRGSGVCPSLEKNTSCVWNLLTFLAKLTYRYACKSIWRCIVFKVDNNKRNINYSDCVAAKDDDEYIIYMRMMIL